MNNISQEDYNIQNELNKFFKILIDCNQLIVNNGFKKQNFVYCFVNFFFKK